MKIKNTFTKKQIGDMYGLHPDTLKRRLSIFWGTEEENDIIFKFRLDRSNITRKEFDVIKRILKDLFGFEPNELIISTDL